MENTIETFGYATMGERFLAFLCDASVETALIGAFLAIFYMRSSLSFEGLKETAVWVIPIAYMTLAEFFFHGTIGKRLLRIQLRADPSQAQYPSLLKVLLRESLGKFLCGLVFGIGFVVAVDQPKKQTWADRMANTVVLRTGVASRNFKVLLIPVLLCVYIGLAIALTSVPSNYKKDLAERLTKAERSMEDLHEKVLLPLFADERPSPAAYQQTMSRLLPMLDEYDYLLAGEQDLVERSRKLARPSDFGDIERLSAYGKLVRLRQEIAALLRRHAEAVVTFDPQKQKWDDVLNDRRQAMHEINYKNNQINQISGIYVPRKIAFEEELR
jgi:uncharacterized RDD family membrane protein YckC